MLVIALILAVIGLAALVTAVVTSNELIAWVCIGASVIGVLLLIVDALRERSRGGGDASREGGESGEGSVVDEQTVILPEQAPAEDYPEEPTTQFAEESPTTDIAGGEAHVEGPFEPDQVTSEAAEPNEPSVQADTSAEPVTTAEADTSTEADKQPGESEPARRD